MAVVRYSQIQHLAITEAEKKQLPHFIELFEQRANKRRSKGEYVQFDPDVVTVDIKRWQYNRRKNNPDVLPTIEQYKTHEELHEAMKDLLSDEEIELQEQEQTETGTTTLFTLPGGYTVYEASTPQALSDLSKGSHWCTQNISTANQYLQDRGNFQIIHKNNKPLAAITIEQVWYFTDYELRDGKNYSPMQSTPYILKEDFTAINKVLKKLSKPEISISSSNREDLVIVNDFAEIQARVDKALFAGDSEELKRALLNLRDFPIQIPEGTVIKGNLNLSETSIRSLPERLSVRGSLYLRGCTSLQSLPEGLSVGEDLDLRDCTSLQSLPEGLFVGVSLDLSGCTSLQYLPEGLSVGASLNLMDCTSLQSLPEGLSVGGSLYLSGCTRLQSLPKRLSVRGYLDLSGCTSLQSLPEDLSVGEDLYLQGCTRLQSLPEGLSVGGNLYLEGCTSLQSLPEDLSVGRDLYLSGCTRLQSLPEGLSVGGGIYGKNPDGIPWQNIYNEMQKNKTASLRKLRIV